METGERADDLRFIVIGAGMAGITTFHSTANGSV